MNITKINATGKVIAGKNLLQGQVWTFDQTFDLKMVKNIVCEEVGKRKSKMSGSGGMPEAE